MRSSPVDSTSASPWGKPLHGWRLRWYTVIFEADTRAGRWFDTALIALILLSLAVVVADSVAPLGQRYGTVFNAMEWVFAVVFTLEYLARLACVRHPLRYATSFFGVIDLLVLAPACLALLFPELHALIDVRVLRLLRVFRVFKLTAHMVAEYQALGQALAASRRKILVFLSTVLMIVVVMGTVMYVVKGPANGFTSIPVSVCWAITTMTTVGFGDITPKADLGRLIASLMMLLGWGTLAVPTGVVTSELSAQRNRTPPTTRNSDECLTEGHRPQARFSFHCGAPLPAWQSGNSRRP